MRNSIYLSCEVAPYGLLTDWYKCVMCSQISFSTDMSKNILKTILAWNIKRYPLKLKVQMLRYCQKIYQLARASSFSSLWSEMICCNEYTMIASDTEMRHNNFQKCVSAGKMYSCCLFKKQLSRHYITCLVTSLTETTEIYRTKNGTLSKLTEVTTYMYVLTVFEKNAKEYKITLRGSVISVEWFLWLSCDWTSVISSIISRLLFLFYSRNICDKQISMK